MPPSSAWKKAARDIALFSKPKTGLEKSLRKSEAGKLELMCDEKAQVAWGHRKWNGFRTAGGVLPVARVPYRKKKQGS